MSRPSAAVPLAITFGSMGALVLGFALWIRYSETPGPIAEPTAAPPAPQEVTQVIDAVQLVGKKKKDVAAVLGEPSGCSKLPKRGDQCSYSGNVSVFFGGGRADWISLNPRPGVDGLEAIKLVGIEGGDARLDFYPDSVIAGDIKVREIFYTNVPGAKGASVSVYRDGTAGMIIVYGLTLDPRLEGIGDD